MNPRSTVPPARTNSGPYRVGLVCLGNICRSPMAEVVVRDRLADAGLAEHVHVDSYGLGPWHVGDGMDRRAHRTLREHGYDGDRHRARQFQRSQFEDYDLVLAMDESNLAQLRRQAPDEATRTNRVELFGAYAGEGTEVPDPYYSGADGFTHVLHLVERAADGLVAALTEARITTRPLT